MTKFETARQAMRFVSAENRETWIMVGMALKSEFGDRAFELWDDWSRTSEKYQPKVLRQQWKSFKNRMGGITLGSLFHEARVCGWDPNRDVKLARQKVVPRKEQPEDQAEIERAIERAASILKSSRWDEHWYFKQKGLDHMQGLVDERGSLIVPIRSIYGRLMSLQVISEKGKRFLPGSKVRNGCYKSSSTRFPEVAWLCEGYATGLTILKTLLSRKIQDDVFTCFSSHNITNMSKVCRRYYRKTKTAIMIAADNDIAGRKAVEESDRDGEWFPPPNLDANDYYQQVGMEQLANELIEERTRMLRRVNHDRWKGGLVTTWRSGAGTERPTPRKAPI